MILECPGDHNRVAFFNFDTGCHHDSTAPPPPFRALTSLLMPLFIMACSEHPNMHSASSDSDSWSVEPDPSGHFLFGVQQADIDFAMATLPVSVATNVDLEPDVDFVDGESDVDLEGFVTAQLTPPFACWKFGDLCEAVGPDAAQGVIGDMWAAVIDGADNEAAQAVLLESFSSAHDEYLGEYELSDAHRAKYADLLERHGIESARRNLFDCTPYTRTSWSGTPFDSLRSRSGVTNVGIAATTWHNARDYDNGTNVKRNICVVTGSGWTQIDNSGNLDIRPYTDKCKNTKKLTHNKAWGSSGYPFNSQGCANESGFSEVCSCRN